MIKFEVSTETDLPLIDEWCAIEPYQSRAIYNIAFLTASQNSLLVFKLLDSSGPTMFVRLEKEDKLVRMHILFGPETVVGRLRIAKAIYVALPLVIQHLKDDGFDGIIFDSVSPDLTKFLGRFGFKPVEGSHDFKLSFENGERDVL